MKKGFFTNKYTLSVFILLAILATDIYLHKGMSRVILPESFTGERPPQTGFIHCNQELTINGKAWVKGVNTAALAATLDSNTNGIEMDVYFDTLKNTFFVYHDSDNLSTVTIDEIFSGMKKNDAKWSVWIDFKNLFKYNGQQSLQHLLELKRKYHLEKRMLVESPNLEFLQPFCDSGFFTSYYVPFFNPYNETEQQLIGRVDSIAANLKKYKVSALSGYYFQMPFLKKFFPVFPLLTWTDDSRTSLVNNVFNRRLQKDTVIKIVLHPADN